MENLSFAFLVSLPGIFVLVVVGFIGFQLKELRRVRAAVRHKQIAMKSIEDMLASAEDKERYREKVVDILTQSFQIAKAQEQIPYSFHLFAGEFLSRAWFNFCTQERFRRALMSSAARQQLVKSLQKYKEALSVASEVDVYETLTEFCQLTVRRDIASWTRRQRRERDAVDELLKDLDECARNLTAAKDSSVAEAEKLIRKWAEPANLLSLPSEYVVPVVYLRDRITQVSWRTETPVTKRAFRSSREPVLRLVQEIKKTMVASPQNPRALLRTLSKVSGA